MAGPMVALAAATVEAALGDAELPTDLMSAWDSTDYDEALRIRRDVTLQESCHLVPAQRIKEAPRKLHASIPGIEVSVVHLVRDPRAAAHSWLRPKAQPDRGGSGLRRRHRDRCNHACCFACDAPSPAGADRARRSGGFKGHAEAIA